MAQAQLHFDSAVGAKEAVTPAKSRFDLKRETVTMLVSAVAFVVALSLNSAIQSSLEAMFAEMGLESKDARDDPYTVKELITYYLVAALTLALGLGVMWGLHLAMD